MLPVVLIDELDRLRTELGMSRSAVLSMAAVCFIAKTSAAIVPTKRDESLAVIEQIFAGLVEEARKTA